MRLLSKLHSVSKIAVFGIFVEEWRIFSTKASFERSLMALPRIQFFGKSVNILVTAESEIFDPVGFASKF